jgi:hypothetical protein
MDVLQVCMPWYGGTFAGWLTVVVSRLREEDQEKRLSMTTRLRVAFFFLCPAAAVCRRQAEKFG